MLQRGRNLKRITNQPGKNWKLPKWRPYSVSKLSKCRICTNRESLKTGSQPKEANTLRFPHRFLLSLNLVTTEKWYDYQRYRGLAF